MHDCVGAPSLGRFFFGHFTTNCCINANTTEDDIRRTVALLNDIAVKETERLRRA